MTSRPRLLVVAGPNGAGKTTITKRGAPRAIGGFRDRNTYRGLAHEWFRGCETVFSAPDKPDFVRRALAAEYFVRIFFVGTDTPEINAARVARRVLQGGHEVPIRKIVDRWARSIANAASIAAEVDRFYAYDNSVDNRDARLVIRTSAGSVARMYVKPPTWMAPIVQRLSHVQK